jgi:CHAT domain-containing protein/tetratricopeptide (TPR) repeat protein
MRVAVELFRQGRFEDAAELFEGTLRQGPETAEHWQWLANCQLELELYEEAVFSLDQAIRLCLSAPAAWNDKGVCLMRLYEFEDAEKCFEQALQLDPRNSTALQNIEEARRSERSLQNSQRVLVEQFEALNASQRAVLYRANFVHKRALQLKELGQYAQATRELDVAVRGYRSLPHCEKLEWAALDRYCDAALKTTGFPPGALIEARFRIRDLMREMGNADPQFKSASVDLDNALAIGAALLGGGRWEEVLWICNQYVEKTRQQDSKEDELRFLTLKVETLQSLNAALEAERTQLKVLEICEAIEEKLRPEVPIFQELMYVQSLLQMRRYDEVFLYAEDARPRALAQKLVDLVFLADVFVATSLFGLGRYDAAYARFKQAFELIKSDNSPSLQGHRGRVLHHMGKSLVRAGKIDEAITAHRAALRQLRIWWVYEGLSRALEAKGDRDFLGEALSSRLRAIEEIEKGSKSFTVSEFQLSWFEDKADIYDNMAGQLLAMEREDIPDLEGSIWQCGNSVEELALHYVDRGKGRSLLQMMSSFAGLTGGSHSALLAERRALANEISALLTLRGPAPRPGTLRRFEKETELIEQRGARQQEIESLLRKSGRTGFIDPEPIRVEEFKETLHHEEACIEYSVMERRLLVFVLTRGNIRFHSVDICREAPHSAWAGGKLDVSRLAALYRENPDAPERLGIEGLVLLQRNWMEQWPRSTLQENEHIALSCALARILLPPVIRELLAKENVKHLLMVPSQWLSLTPFCSLVVGVQPRMSKPTFRDCRFVLNDYSLSFVPSLAVLKAIRQRERVDVAKASLELLAFADPVHYDSDPRATEHWQWHETENREAVEPKSTHANLVRSFDSSADGSGHEVWSRLPETRMEALAVAKTFGSHVVIEESVSELSDIRADAVVCVGHAASRDLAMSRAIERSRNILFSVHGHADMDNPWLSQLVLTDRGAKEGSRQPAPLTMSDIFNLTLHADTVVLAACETGKGRLRMGEGIVGLPLAFLAAGAQSVVNTQWQIPSALKTARGAEAYPSTTVVKTLYHNLRESGLSLAEALRRAQLQVQSEDDEFKDPFFWAAWQLNGEWASKPASRRTRALRYLRKVLRPN